MNRNEKRKEKPTKYAMNECGEVGRCGGVMRCWNKYQVDDEKLGRSDDSKMRKDPLEEREKEVKES